MYASRHTKGGCVRPGQIDAHAVQGCLHIKNLLQEGKILFSSDSDDEEPKPKVRVRTIRR